MKKKLVRSFLSLFLCLVMAASVLAGCGKTEEKKADSTAAKASQTASSQTSGPEELKLPIVDKPITLSMFVSMDAKVSATRKNYSEMEAFQEMEKRTGIKIEFQHPAGNQIVEAFNLMMAANQLPDLISYSWGNVPGGFEKFVTDGQTIKVNEYAEKYAPNLMKIFKDRPDVRKDLVSDKGTMGYFPSLRLEKTTRYFESFTIRKDWLDKLNLKAPTTMDEWYTVLKAFKEKDPNGNGKADEIPFIGRNVENLNIHRFASAWGINGAWQVNNCFYVDNGKIKFSPLEPAYKDYLTTMNKWYKEGLIDPDYLSTDNKGADSKILNNIGGAFYGKMNGHIGTYMGTMQGKDPKFNLEPTPYPKAADGKVYDMHSVNSSVDGGGLAITSKCKYPKEAAKWIDYLYSEPGIILTNFGIENFTYKMENGKPVYTEYITKNPDKLPLVQAIAKHAPAGIGPRMVNDGRYWEQVMLFPQQKLVFPTISNSSNERQIPNISLLQEESSKFSSIINEAKTYVEEMSAKIVMGEKPITEYDTMVKTLGTMKINDAIAIQQAAYDRYQKR